MHYEARIESGGLNALAELIGVQIGQVYCPAVEVLGTWIVAASFTIALPTSRFLVLSSEWLETPVHCLDYFQLSAVVSDEPGGIQLVEAPGGGHDLGYPVSSIAIAPPLLVTRIGVYTTCDSSDSLAESVEYDGLVVLEATGGNRIAFLAEQSIAGRLELTLDQDLVARAIEHSQLRRLLP
jgi:hypothetical protein